MSSVTRKILGEEEEEEAPSFELEIKEKTARFSSSRFLSMRLPNSIIQIINHLLYLWEVLKPDNYKSITP